MIVVVDYGLGNLFSVAKAFEMIGAEVMISADPAAIAQADRLVLPGVGAFGDGMDYLSRNGLDKILSNEVLVNKKPFLGICLGMQLLGDVGFEYGEHKGLSWIKGKVRKLEVSGDLKVPHVGWNDVVRVKESPMFEGIKNSADFYFVHSYQLVCEESDNIVATTTYGETVTAAVQKDNIFATQFHPEKSQEVGLKLLENFVNWEPLAL
jgi:glutamine amidotransferase